MCQDGPGIAVTIGADGNCTLTLCLKSPTELGWQKNASRSRAELTRQQAVVAEKNDQLAANVKEMEKDGQLAEKDDQLVEKAG